MPQPIKYLIVALLCLGLGALVGILLYTKLSPLELIRKSLQTGTQVTEIAKDPAKAAAASLPSKANDQTAKKEAPKSPEPSKTPDASPTDKSGVDKKESGKTEEKDKKESDPDAPEYLRALWPIKKRKSTDLSAPPKGSVYFDGTSPYGPPPTYKEDLFAETKTLTVAGEPPPRFSPPLSRLEKAEGSFSSEDPRSSPSFSVYQIEFGRFFSLRSAQKACDILREKGYEVDVYYTGSFNNPDAFYVRLSSEFTKPQAYQKAQTIAILEKIVPQVVPLTPAIKKLR